MAREYAQRQDSYWFPEEWNFLKAAVQEADIQALLATGDNEKVRGVLVERFRDNFTGPVEGESEADFKKRVRGTSRARKAEISRRVTESQQEWEKRMETLPDAIRDWLKNWKTKVKCEHVRKWTPPAPPAPPKRKNRATTAFEAFSKSPAAPQGGQYLTADGRRCDIQALQAARKAEWAKLSIDEREQYREAAAAIDLEKGEGGGINVGDIPNDTQREPVAHAEDIATHVDQFVTILHESVSWGGFAVFGGPDENGQGRLHVTTAGRNRHGQTFFDAFLQTVGWTPLEFDTVFSLWVEQCREGPLVDETSTFAIQARRAVEYVRAKRDGLLVPGGPASSGAVPASTAGILMTAQAINGWLSDPHRVTRYPVMNYDSMDPAGQVKHALINGLAALQHARTAAVDNLTHTPLQHTRTASAENAPAIQNGLPSSTALALPSSSHTVSGTRNTPTASEEPSDIHFTSATAHENPWPLDSASGETALTIADVRWEQEDRGEPLAGPEEPDSSARELPTSNEGKHLQRTICGSY